MDEYLGDFITESLAALGRLDSDLVALESDPTHRELLNSAFRAIHSIKGTCGMFGLVRLEKLSHAVEDVLVRLRDGNLVAEPGVMQPILTAVDEVRTIVVTLQSTRREPPGDDSMMITGLRALLDGSAVEPITAMAPESAPSRTVSASPRPSGAIESREAPVDHELRVKLELLDRLMNLISELVILRNGMLRELASESDTEKQVAIQQLNRLTHGLQEAIMKTRMQPIGNSWGRLQRVVRDVAHAAGKQIRLEISGKETEIDRQIMLAVQDPVTHCIRNSADHGIERPDERVAAGKPPLGTIQLEARSEAGKIVVQIRDDGKGIDASAVKRKAIERGLIDEVFAARMSESETLDLIFAPGLSTAARITETSGRGVGMDVVKSNVEQIGGSIRLSSTLGRGTQIELHLPLTLAVIPAFIVGIGGRTFAVPQAGVSELVRVDERNRGNVKTLRGASVLELRDKVLPLIDLAEVLGLSDAKSGTRETNSDFHVIISEASGVPLGFRVDEIHDSQEIVVKRPGRLVSEIGLYVGITLMGDGSVVMILDLLRLAEKSLGAGIKDRAKEAFSTSSSGIEEPAGETHVLRVLTFRSISGALRGVSAELVNRLKVLPVETIERNGSQVFAMDQGELLRLVLPESPDLDPGPALQDGTTAFPAVVVSDGATTVAILVAEIKDIVEERTVMSAGARKTGSLGVARLRDAAVDLLDAREILRRAEAA